MSRAHSDLLDETVKGYLFCLARENIEKEQTQSRLVVFSLSDKCTKF